MDIISIKRALHFMLYLHYNKLLQVFEGCNHKNIMFNNQISVVLMNA